MAEFLIEIDGAREGRIGVGRRCAQRFAQVIGQPAWEVKDRIGRRLTILNRRFPTDFNAREQIGLGADGFEQACGFEAMGAENLCIRVEGHLGAAPVGGCADFLHRALGDAAGKALLPQLSVTGDLDNHQVRQSVHNRGPHPVQTARRLIGLAREFAARV